MTDLGVLHLLCEFKWYEGNQKDDTYFLEAGTLLTETESSEKFLRSLSIRDKIKIYGAEHFTKSKPDHYRYEKGVNGFNPEFDIDGLEYAIGNMTLKKSLFLWSVMLGHTSKLKGYIKTRRILADEFEQGEEQSSQAMKTLSGKSWLYNKAGELITSPIEEIQIDELHDDYKADDNSEKLEKVLGMKLDTVSKFMKENPDLEVVKKEHLKEVEDKAKLWDQNQEQERRKKEASDAKTWQEEASPEEATIQKGRVIF